MRPPAGDDDRAHPPRLRHPVHPADRPPRARGRRLLRDPPLHRRTTPRSARFAPAAIILSGGPASTTEAEAPRAPAAVFELGVPVLGICYGEQTMCAQLGGKVEPGQHREFGRAVHRRDRALRRCSRACSSPGAREQVWMSHGDSVAALPPGFRVIATSRRARRSPPSPTTRGASTACSSTPRSSTPPRGAALLAELPLRVAGCRGDWTMAAFREQAIARDPRPGRRAAGSSAASPAASIPRSPRCCCTRRSATSSPASSSTTACCATARPRRWSTLFRGHFNIPLVAVDAATRFLERSPASPTRRQKRKIIGGTFIDVFEDEAKSRRRRVPRPGHALSRRDRERLVQGPVRHHQDPPQRRRPARAHAARAGRAAARAVQGRGARARPRARPARGLRLPPSVPRPRPRRAHPRRGHQRAPRRAAPGRRASSSRRSATPACTTPSGRPSPCCCRCAPSASWATRAPTRTCCALRAVTSATA